MELEPLATDSRAIPRRRHQRRALWRLTGWGAAAALGLCAVALASQSETGSKRLVVAFREISEPSPTVVVAAAERRATEAQAENRRLAAKLRELIADRDRLNARLASLESDIDMTGSIERRPRRPRSPRYAMPAPRGASLPLAPVFIVTPAPRPLAANIEPLAMPGGLTVAMARLRTVATCSSRAAGADTGACCFAVAGNRLGPSIESSRSASRCRCRRCASRLYRLARAPPRREARSSPSISAALCRPTFCARDGAEMKANFGPLFTELLSAGRA